MVSGLAVALVAGACAATPARAPRIRPPVWLNTGPDGPGQLDGRVVLVEFWTYGCINCVRTVPAVREIHDTYRDRGLVVVAVHSPEFEEERELSRVRDAVQKLGIAYPVAVDSDHAIWRAFSNRYWPAFYLVDRAGHVRLAHVGELHRGTRAWSELVAQIERRLAEPAAGEPSRP